MSARLFLRCMALCALAVLPEPGSRAAAPVVDAQAAQGIGRWLTDPPDGLIEISLAPDGTYQGKIVGGDSPNRTDLKNPDPAKRSAQLLGQRILRDLKYDGAGHWSGGNIYDPDSGHSYSCYLELLAPNKLKVRGYMGFSLLGRTQIWTRYTGTSPLLPKVTTH
jgi:uncharacterized protein (DUF2147 family)